MPEGKSDGAEKTDESGLFADMGSSLQDTLYLELIDHYTDQLALLKKDSASDNRAEIARTHISLGETFSTLSNWKDALYHFSQAELFEEAMEDWKERVDLHEKMGEIYTQQNRWNKAIRSFRMAREIAETNNDDSEEWHLKMSSIYHGMGRIYWRKGTYKKAMHFLERSISIHGGANVTTSSTYVELGNLMTEIGQPEKGVKNYERALEILDEIGDEYHKSRIYNNMSDLYMKQEDFETAMNFVNKCITTSNATQNRVLLAYGYANGAEIRARQGIPEEASDFADRAEEIFRELDAIYPMGNVHLVRGIIATVLKEWDRGVGEFNESIRLFEEADIPYYRALGMYELAVMLKKKGDLTEAAKRAQDALNIWQEIGADAKVGEAKAFLKDVLVK